jgi:hypothetical protein
MIKISLAFVVVRAAVVPDVTPVEWFMKTGPASRPVVLTPDSSRAMMLASEQLVPNVTVGFSTIPAAWV